MGAEIAFGNKVCRLLHAPGSPILPLVQIRGHLGIRLWIQEPVARHSQQEDAVVLGGPFPSLVMISLCLQDLPRMRPAMNVCPEAVEVIRQARLPICAQRTNLAQNTDEPTRGLVFGGYRAHNEPPNRYARPSDLLMQPPSS